MIKTFYQHQKTKYLPLIKLLQTTLLLITGLAGYMSGRCPILNPLTILGITLSLFLSISGSTILNMWIDRDIDSKMNRTCLRPLPTGKVSPKEALRFGLIISIIGISFAFAMDLLYGVVIFAGLFFDVVVYSLWLKRKTAWSILWGGISGGMPILAGRVLAIGTIDWVGIAFMLAVLFWIPTHTLTYSMKYFDDYNAANIPTFPLRYGFSKTRRIITISTVLAAIAVGFSVVGIGMSWGYLRLIGVLSAGLFLLSISSILRPTDRINFGLFRYASFFMLSIMIITVIEVL